MKERLNASTQLDGYVFLDFEFRDHPQDGIALVCGCFHHLPSEEKVVIDFRQPEIGYAQLRELQRRWIRCVWFAYSARAEMKAFLAAGLDIADMMWVDLMTEGRQVTGTHHYYPARRASLLATLEALGIKTDSDPVWKEAMRLLILSKTVYTDEEFAEIIRYCWADVFPCLALLWADLLKIHSQRKDAVHPVEPSQLLHAIFRADFLKAISRLEFRGHGFPIDVDWLNRIYDNHKAIRRFIAEDCNREYGGKVFRHVKRTDEYAFHHAGLESYLEALPPELTWGWDRTPSGKRKLDADFLDEFCRRNGHFEPLRKTLALLSQLKSGDLRTFLKDGYIQGSSLPFYTVTSRSQPLATEGFVFSLAHWLRSVVRPHPGMVLIGNDWSQQEIVIGAALSGDRRLAAALATGDVYLALGQMAGAIPEGATKKSHPLERQAFKSVQLGIGYGMGAYRLGYTLYLDLLKKGAAITLDEATERAVEILKWHKSTFTAYWQFIREEVATAQNRGWTRARDGWTYFANKNSSFTKLQNFPFQANAAVMLREAIKDLADIPEIDLVCTLHDAIYINAPEDDALIHQNHLTRCMRDAAKRTLQHAPLQLEVGIESHVYTHESGYIDPDGAEMVARVQQILADLRVPHGGIASAA